MRDRRRLRASRWRAAGWSQPAARPITQADLATLTEKVRRRVVRWFRMQRLIDADAASDMLRWENSGFSVDASVRITLIDRDVPSYFQSLEHLLRYCARPPFALERLSVRCGEAVTALAIGNIGRPRGPAAGGHAAGGQATDSCCDTHAKPRSHDTSRIAWAKLMARVCEEFPFACPGCGGDIRRRGDGR